MSEHKFSEFEVKVLRRYDLGETGNESCVWQSYVTRNSYLATLTKVLRGCKIKMAEIGGTSSADGRIEKFIRKLCSENSKR